MTETSLLQQPPLSLYVHIPWCVRKCPYCDFNSHEAGDEIDQAAYASALMLDLEHELALVSQREIQSIFIGGGTPSLFSAKHIDSIINGIRKRMPVAADAEITLEANPGTIEQQRFADYRASGINRLTIDIQSFDNDKLEKLGRIHDRDEAIKAIETARAAGFDNFNLDLMFGLPRQSVEQAVADATLACEFDPAHLSHYQLTIEANTFFHKHRPALPLTDTLWEMQQRCHDVIGQHGYTHYEVSAFSTTGKQCLHNLNYWQFGDYIGIGAGAHGKITDIRRQAIQRRWKHRQPAAYISNTLRDEPCSGTSELDQADLMFEFLLNALRLRQGFDFELFEQRTGIDRTRLVEACNNIDPALLTLSESGLNTSERGFDFLNDVLYGFLPEHK